MAEGTSKRLDERTAAEARGGSSPEWGEHGALPLELSVRLAEGRARLGELRDLSAGVLVSLETAVGEPFRLLAEGAVIGAGEIVELRGRLALRLSRLGRDGA